MLHVRVSVLYTSPSGATVRTVHSYELFPARP
jgi:hypothetical protein